MTIVAYIILVGSAVGFAILWSRSEDAHTLTRKRLTAMSDAMEALRFQIDALRKKAETDLNAAKNEIIVKIRESRPDDDDAETKVMPLSATVTPTIRSRS